MVKGGFDLLPGRIQSEWSVVFERTATAILGLIVLAAMIIGVVEGFGTGHPEHVFMAVVLGLVSANWFMVARKYTQDVFQERNLVYFGALTVFLLAVATMMYGLHWGAIEPTAAEQALQSCTAGTATSCYNSDVANPQTGVSGCIKFGSALTGGTVPGGRPPPTVLGQNCMVWNNLTLTFAQLVSPAPTNKTITCAQANTFLSRCGGGIIVNCTAPPRTMAATAPMLAVPQYTTPMTATTQGATTTQPATDDGGSGAGGDEPGGDRGSAAQPTVQPDTVPAADTTTTPPGTSDPGRS
eukprot:m.303995 g.303995  ORF g.303995 m.303995 type:complete len:297 (+) comp27311_c2_seq11:116-1006(+)